VVPEAMAAGLPVITTAVGGLPGVVDDQVTGLVVRDEPAFAAALATLEADRPRARAMGQRGREVALVRFGAARMVDAYLALYAQARR